MRSSPRPTRDARIAVIVQGGRRVDIAFPDALYQRRDARVNRPGARALTAWSPLRYRGSMPPRALVPMPARAALAAIVLALALPALAATYKWVDANGRVVYADQPPGGGLKYEVVGSAPPPDNPNAVREMANKDAELKKLQKDRVEGAQKAEKSRADAQKRADVCTQARAAARTYQSDQPLMTVNEKGERVYLEGTERSRRLAEQQRLIREYCAAG